MKNLRILFCAMLSLLVLSASATNDRLQSSTSNPIPFLMVLASDHVTAATGLTPTVTISKNGGAFASPSGAVTELANGWYLLAGNATDRATLGSFIIHATGTGADPTDALFTITAYDPFDGVHFGLTGIPNAAAGASGGLLISGSNAGTTTFGAFTVTGAMSINGTGNVAQTGDSYGRIGAAGVGLTNLGDTRIANLDAAVSSRMATYTQPTGFLAATFPSGTIANTTNITAGTISLTSGYQSTLVAAILAGVVDTTGPIDLKEAAKRIMGAVVNTATVTTGSTTSTIHLFAADNATTIGSQVIHHNGSGRDSSLP